MHYKSELRRQKSYRLGVYDKSLKIWNNIVEYNIEMVI